MLAFFTPAAHFVARSSVQVQAAFEEDDTPIKHNIGLSGFREDSGRLFVPPSVRQVERILLSQPSSLSDEPLPVEGYQPFLDAGVKFAYGDNVWAYKEKHVNIQNVPQASLTNLRSVRSRLSRSPVQFASAHRFCRVSLLRSRPGLSRFQIPRRKKTPLLCETPALRSGSSDFLTAGRAWLTGTGCAMTYMYVALRSSSPADVPQEAPMKSVVLLQLGGSQPTGAEPSDAQWRLLAEIVKVG